MASSGPPPASSRPSAPTAVAAPVSPRANAAVSKTAQAQAAADAERRAKEPAYLNDPTVSRLAVGAGSSGTATSGAGVTDTATRVRRYKNGVTMIYHPPAPPPVLAPAPPAGPADPYRGLVRVHHDDDHDDDDVDDSDAQERRTAATAATTRATASATGSVSTSAQTGAARLPPSTTGATAGLPWTRPRARDGSSDESGDGVRTLIVLDGVYLRRISFAVDFTSLIDQLHARLQARSYHRILCAAHPLEDDAVVELCLYPPDGPGLEVDMSSWRRGVLPSDPVRPRDRAGVDASIATAILLHAWTDQCDRIVVVSGDGYFTEALKLCRDLIGKVVVVAGTYTTLSPLLQMAASDVLYLDGILHPIGDGAGAGVSLPRSLRGIGKFHSVELAELARATSRQRISEADADAVELQARAHRKAQREHERERELRARAEAEAAAAGHRGAAAAVHVDDTPDEDVPMADVDAQRPTATVPRVSPTHSPATRGATLTAPTQTTKTTTTAASSAGHRSGTMTGTEANDGIGKTKTKKVAGADRTGTARSTAST
jgi:uncharacterized LabA/DUF88 family protein